MVEKGWGWVVKGVLVSMVGGGSCLKETHVPLKTVCPISIWLFPLLAPTAWQPSFLWLLPVNV